MQSGQAVGVGSNAAHAVSSWRAADGIGRSMYLLESCRALKLIATGGCDGPAMGGLEDRKDGRSIGAAGSTGSTSRALSPFDHHSLCRKNIPLEAFQPASFSTSPLLFALWPLPLRYSHPARMYCARHHSHVVHPLACSSSVLTPQ